MSKAIRKLAVLWTGGKDCALALHEIRAAGQGVDCLVTFAPERPEFLAHPLPVMAAQAQSLNLPHHLLTVQAPYEEGYRQAIARLHEEHGIDALVTGDIDLVDGRPNWIAQCCHGTPVQVHSPLWQRNREELMLRLVSGGFVVILSCVKSPWFTPDWLGTRIDRAGLERLRELTRTTGLDLCGENGEYHSLVLDGPGFERPVDLGPVRPAQRDDMTYFTGLAPRMGNR